MSECKDPFPNKEFRDKEFVRSDMTGANFNGVDLSNSKFWAVLENARYHDSNLKKSEYDDVDLGESTYENVNLSGAKFNNVNLSDSTFSNLNLANAVIKDANLQGMKINGVLVTELFEAWERSS